MIFEGLGTGERSLTFAIGLFFALGASFFAAAITRLRFAISGSPWAIGQRCSGITESALVTSSTSPPSTMPRRLLSKRQSLTFFSSCSHRLFQESRFGRPETASNLGEYEGRDPIIGNN